MIRNRIDKIKERKRKELEEEKKRIMEERDFEISILDKKLAIEKGDEKVIQEVNDEVVAKDNNNRYLLRHIKEAEQILTRIAYPKSIKNFLEYETIKFNWSPTVKGSNGSWKTSEKTMIINPVYLLDCYKFEDNFDQELVGTIQHELIHAFIGMDKNFELNTSADASPVHEAIITFFNAHGCNISSNGNLSEVFRIQQSELYNYATHVNTTFVQLYEKLNIWQLELMKKINDYNQNRILNIVSNFVINNQQSELLKYVIPIFRENCEKSYVRSWKIVDFKYDDLILKTKRFDVNLGMDCDLDNFEEFINKLINDYQSDIE